MVTLWLVVAVEVPLAIFFYRLAKAVSHNDYHRLSSLVKYIMVGGISSMAIIWLNFRF
jgi:hypothetical protein